MNGYVRFRQNLAFGRGTRMEARQEIRFVILKIPFTSQNLRILSTQSRATVDRTTSVNLSEI